MFLQPAWFFAAEINSRNVQPGIRSSWAIHRVGDQGASTHIENGKTIDWNCLAMTQYQSPGNNRLLWHENAVHDTVVFHPLTLRSVKCTGRLCFYEWFLMYINVRFLWCVFGCGSFKTIITVSVISKINCHVACCATQRFHKPCVPVSVYPFWMSSNNKHWYVNPVIRAIPKSPTFLHMLNNVLHPLLNAK